MPSYASKSLSLLPCQVLHVWHISSHQLGIEGLIQVLRLVIKLVFNPRIETIKGLAWFRGYNWSKIEVAVALSYFSFQFFFVFVFY